MVIFASVTEVSKKNDVILERVLYIYYLVLFKKNKVHILINLDSKVNIMILGYASKLDLKIYFINVEA